MQRREFITTTAAASLAAGLGGAAAGQTAPSGSPRPTNGGPFTLDYAPHLGLFRHHAGDDAVAQIDFMAEAGFRSMEDNGMRGRSLEDQQRISEALQRNGMRLGVFVMNMDGAWRPSLTTGSADERARFVEHARESVEVAKRTDATWMTVVCGEVAEGVPMEEQTANVIEALKQASAVLEPHGLVMVCEPLNWRDHRGQFLRYTPQSIEIMRAVDSPSCRILQDLYHQQATEGNLIDHMNAAWDYIPYFQVGDNPGRREPGTGEINYANVFKHMHSRGYDGIVGMEHGKSMGGKEGEVALIEAYRSVDPS
ncbi:MAG: TIM barrel protein [Planctomycetota bacterium]|nr:TIM barrel protein [Planctomycetota bacterium]